MSNSTSCPAFVYQTSDSSIVIVVPASDLRVIARMLPRTESER